MCVSTVSAKRRQAEKRAQQTFPLRHPSDRFDVERMQGEQSRHRRAAPNRSRQPSKNPKDKQSVRRMEPEIGAVEPDRVQTIDCMIQLQRHPGQWMPKTGPIGPCPANTVSSQPSEHLRISGDVNIVVVIDELAGADPAESQQGEPKQSQTD